MNDKSCNLQNFHENNRAVSEIIGSVILIGIVVAAVSIVGVVLWSQRPPQKLPSLSTFITNQSCTVFVNHEGGDSLEWQSFQILVDGTNQTANFSKRGTSGAWTIWEIGDTLVYTSPPPCVNPPQRVDIVYNDGTSSFVITSAFFGSFSSSAPTVSMTATPVPPPVADFNANPLVGTVPLPVTFTDTSTGSPTTWNWTFGDIRAGNTSTVQNPSHMYTTAGTYSVNLTVTNAGGSNTLIKTNYITVTPPAPVANFTGTPTTGPAPLSVSFTDTSTGSPTSWIWTFGDIGAGNTSMLQNPVHNYLTNGNYNVTLLATNGFGSNIVRKDNYIVVNSSIVCFSDNFNDNSIGPAWTFIGGTWSESGGVLAQTSSANGDPRKAIISNAGLINNQNYVITAKVRIDSWVDGDYARGGVSLFSNTGDGNGYNLVFHNDHNTIQWLDDWVAWGPSYTFSWNTGTWYRFKMKSESGTLYGKVWQDGTSEPATWPFTWARSGRTGYPALNGGSSNGVSSATVSFDDVTVCPN